jgi:pimeloyl-ACP methyl ester carboxylesterase
MNLDVPSLTVTGDGPGTIVMCHGWPDTHHLWDAQVAHFAPRWRCARFTWPGFDTSAPGSAVGHRLDDLVDTLAGVVDRVSPDRPVVLMLHDWGCLFGITYAMRHPQRVSHVVLLDVGDVASDTYRRRLTAKAVAMTLGYQLWLALAWSLGGAWGDRMTRWMARQLRAPVMKTAPERVGHRQNYPYHMMWFGSHGGLRGAAVPEMKCPTFFAWGTRKPFMFHSGEWVQALSADPRNRALALPTGHWLMVQAPEALHDALEAWLPSPTAAPFSPQAAPTRPAPDAKGV